MEILLVEAELSQSGSTALKKLIVAFNNVTEAPKIVNFIVTTLTISNLADFNTNLRGFDPVIEKISV